MGELEQYRIESMTGSNVIHFNQVDCGVVIEFKYNGLCTGRMQTFDSMARQEIIDDMIDEFDRYHH